MGLDRRTASKAMTDCHHLHSPANGVVEEGVEEGVEATAQTNPVEVAVDCFHVAFVSPLGVARTSFVA